MQKEISEQNALLFEAILTLKDRDECRAFSRTCAPWLSCGP